MQLLMLLIRHAGGMLKWTVLCLAVSALAAVAILVIVNAGIDPALESEERHHLLVLGAGATLVYALVHRQAMRRVSRQFEAIIIDLRERLLTRLRHAEFLQADKIDRAAFYSGISAEMRTISYCSPIIAEMLHSVFVIAAITLYIFVHSPLAALCCLAFVAASIAIVAARRVQAEEIFTEASELENVLLGHVGDMMDGAKELRMDDRRASELSRKVMEVAHDIGRRKHVAIDAYVRSVVESQAAFNILILFVIFVLPQIASYSFELVSIALALMFVAGPVLTIVGSLPSYMGANNAAMNVLALENRLPVPRIVESHGAESCFDNFKAIHLKDALFGHRSQDGSEYWIGPVNLTIERGRVILVTGGNGSGKSTLLRMLLGLYRLYDGRITVDSMVVEPSTLGQYRKLFAVVFSDNHLFRELYGIQSIDAELARDMLEFLEISDKARIEGRSFSTLKLSGGQRKRLALIAAILEKKPICVLDEWAADQEPYFRAKFYREVLPRLRDLGMTVIAITHDREYLSAADVHWHVERGMVVSVQEVGGLPQPA
ncbi:ATP-binding cassette domain-containing protein [Arenibaculum pallidiluteum]|uniref:ATP-binding cassette domain-containing protein n=1 Tax=Arenibaculum pallidiluteum TaxID=2812559 RepID=UPI001A96AD33|nr:ATP-binding cassette domain-containing protein [Arenibaculum pallidiluteum]